MNKYLKIFSFAITLLFVSISSQAAQVSADAPAMSRIVKSGQLVLGTSGNQPPMTMLDKSGKPAGFDIDLASLMAQALEVKLVIKTIPFNELLSALESGKVDVVISNMTINPGRNMRVAFVGPYMTSGKCLITKKENLAKTDDAAELNITDMKLVVLKGSTSEDIVSTLMPKVKLTTVENIDKGIKMVADDKMGGMMADYPVCLHTINANPKAGFISVFSMLTYEPIGIALPANDALFVNWTTNFLERLDKTETLEVLATKWLGELMEEAGK
ncbi:MAG: transporter substrate-binding domain-containing protein [Arenicellales bacterium]